MGQSNFLQSLGWALLNSLWQMALLWVTYQVITSIFRKAGPSHKSSLATFMLITGFGWFIATFISILRAGTPENGAIPAMVFTSASSEQVNNWLRASLPVASLIYLSLLVLPVLGYIRNYRYVQTIRRFDLSKADIGWRMFVKNVSGHLGIRKPVQVWLSGLVSSPVTIGYVKPIILLPFAAVNQLSPQQIEAVLLHELAHIRRYDYLYNLLIRFIQAVLYFNPFINALVKTIEREREKSCDGIVMQFQYDPYGYASALLTIEKIHHTPKILAVAAAGRKNDLLHRIECLLGVQPKKQFVSFNKLAGLLAGLLCFIAFNALLILSKPMKNDSAVASLTHLSSPFYIYTNGPESVGSEKTHSLPAELANRTIVNNIPKDNFPATEAYVEYPAASVAVAKMPATPSTPGFMNVAFTASPTFVDIAFSPTPVIPELKKYQEEQVQCALDASRKIVEEKQWQQFVETKIAEVMTSEEKKALKTEYEKQMKNVDWKKMGDMLRLSYAQIEWNKVNDQLNMAMTEIRLDSLQQAYTQAIDELSQIQRQLAENNLSGIPDTDISLKAVEQGKKEIQKAITNLIRSKAKKVVHL